LFWKRKRKDNRLFSFDSGNQRSSFRVAPLKDAPIRIDFQGRSVRVLNIGAVGLAFADEGFQVGDNQVIELTLPGEPRPLASKIEVVEIDSDNVCHCAFIDLEEDSVNAIHRYMLRVQVQEIRNAKAPSEGQ